MALELLEQNRKVLWVAGGRDFDDGFRMVGALGEEPDDALLITGAARGADLLAEDIWRRSQRPYIGIPASWRNHGKAAGAIRNNVIAYLRPHELLLFPGGRGTSDARQKAERYGIPVRYAE